MQYWQRKLQRSVTETRRSPIGATVAVAQWLRLPHGHAAKSSPRPAGFLAKWPWKPPHSRGSSAEPPGGRWSSRCPFPGRTCGRRRRWCGRSRVPAGVGMRHPCCESNHAIRDVFQRSQHPSRSATDFFRSQSAVTAVGRHGAAASSVASKSVRGTGADARRGGARVAVARDARAHVLGRRRSP